MSTAGPVTPVRWGVLGTGQAAASVAHDLPLVPGAQAFAVASRDAARAGAFAARHGFVRSHGSYQDLVDDPDVDVVYVATPHSHHLATAGLAVRAGKPVLVEKAFTSTAAGARELVDLARRHEVFCMESLWTRFLPNAVHLVELVSSGALGAVRSLQASIGWRVPLDPGSRFLDPDLGGGALLDAGVYGVWLAHELLGPPTGVQATGRLAATGVDLEASLLMTHPGPAARSGAGRHSETQGGPAALLSASLDSVPSRRAWVECAEGAVEVPASFEKVPALVVHRAGLPPETVDLGRTGLGYAHVLDHVQQCLAAGLTESPVLPLRSTLEVMTVLDAALGLVGAVHREARDPVPR